MLRKCVIVEHCFTFDYYQFGHKLFSGYQLTLRFFNLIGEINEIYIDNDHVFIFSLCTCFLPRW